MIGQPPPARIARSDFRHALRGLGIPTSDLVGVVSSVDRIVLSYLDRDPETGYLRIDHATGLAARITVRVDLI